MPHVNVCRQNDEELVHVTQLVESGSAAFRFVCWCAHVSVSARNEGTNPSCAVCCMCAAGNTRHTAVQQGTNVMFMCQCLAWHGSTSWLLHPTQLDADMVNMCSAVHEHHPHAQCPHVHLTLALSRWQQLVAAACRAVCLQRGTSSTPSPCFMPERQCMARVVLCVEPRLFGSCNVESTLLTERVSHGWQASKWPGCRK